MFILLSSLGEANESHLLSWSLIARSVFENLVPDDAQWNVWDISLILLVIALLLSSLNVCADHNV